MTDYTTVHDIKAQPNITGTQDDLVIQALITAASAAIDRYCNRPDGFQAAAAATTRYFTGTGKYYLFVDEFATASGLAVAVKDSATDDEDEYETWTVGTVGTTTDADVFPATGDPRTPTYNRTPYTMLVIGPNADNATVFTDGRLENGPGLPTVKVTARWGYATTCPAQIAQATIIQVCRWLARGQSKWADTLGNAETGTLEYRKALDPDLKMILSLGGFVRPVV